MNNSKLLSDILNAESHNSCLMASYTKCRKSLRTYLKSNNLVEPYRGLYALSNYWQRLSYKDKVLHIAIPLTQKIKIKEWKFTGETAAALKGFEVIKLYSNQPKSISIHVSCAYADKNLTNTSEKSAKKIARRQLKRIHLPDIVEDENGIRLEECYKRCKKQNSPNTCNSNVKTCKHTNEKKTSTFGHIKTMEEDAMSHVASIYNTLFVEAWTNPFRIALPTFDSASQKGENLEKIYNVCSEFYGFARYQCNASQLQDDPYLRKIYNPYFSNIDYTDALSRLKLLCNFASDKSENAGESLARATIIELGFIVPQIQYEFPNNKNPNYPLRADFAWNVNGNLIVGEFDGTDKYLIECGKSSVCNISQESSKNTIITDLHEKNMLLQYDRDAVRKERDRERYLYDCGVSKIVRFDFAEVINPQKLEQKLASAGIPKAYK